MSRVQFDIWGSRGSRNIVPVRSAIANHTSCYSLLDGSDLFVLDAGRGLAALAQALSAEARFGSVTNIHVLVTHAHMDHWEGLKDAEWFWRRGTGLRVRIFGTREALDTILAGYAHPHYVPLDLLARTTVDRLEYVALRADDEITIGRVRVRTARMNHYSGEGDSRNVLDTIGYRLAVEGGPIVSYISDHEPAPGTEAVESGLLAGTHLAVVDSHFSDIGQHAHGHGSQEYTALLARHHPEVLVLAGHLGPLFSDTDIQEARRRHAAGLPNYRLAAEGDRYLWGDGAFAHSPRGERVGPAASPEDAAAAARARSKARHDLRTPINQIIGYAELLAEQAEDEGRKDVILDLERIRSAARSQLELIGEIFAEPGQAPVERAHEEPAAATPPATPRSPPAERAPAAGGSPHEGPSQGHLLVVDDNAANREMLSRRLQARGFTVAAAEDGQQALDMIQAQEFELILLDVMMPGLSGIEVLKILRQAHTASDLPVIMATARDASEDIVTALGLGANDYVTKPLDFPVVMARVNAQLALKRQKDEIERLADGLEVRNRFIRNTFGRYLSDEVVAGLLESPEGLRLGGESRRVTILMSDLRGFTAVSERLGPEQVVRLLNTYLGAMAEIILRYHGTIDEFVGDAILAIFGAPVSREDDACRAVACGVSMQRAMQEVNAQLQAEGLPAIEMGVAIHTGDVVVGNIGSQRRTKYGIVGPPVNLAGRIESYTVGGQILISEAALRETGPVVKVGGEIHIKAKGAAEPVTVYDLIGIGGEYNVYLDRQEGPLRRLAREVPVRFWLLDGKLVGDVIYEGAIVKLSLTGAEVQAAKGIRPLSNLKIELLGEDGSAVSGDLYAKVLEAGDQEGAGVLLRFTSVPPGLEQHLRALLARP